MAVATRTQSPRSRALSAALRKAREDTGMSSRELADRLSLDQSHLSRIETGKRTPNIETTAMILAVLRTTRDERERILDLARNAGEPNWLTAGAPGIPHQLAGVCECERAASRVTCWHHSFVPGLLQTSDYARAITVATAQLDSLPASDVERRVKIKESRREILFGSDPLPFVGLISEAVLREHIGTPEVMLEQLRCLLVMSERRNVSIRVIPQRIGWHPGLLGPFVLYEFSDGSPVVHLEHHSSGVFNQDDDDVNAYRRAVTELIRVGLSEIESRQLIDRVMNEWSAECA